MAILKLQTVTHNPPVVAEEKPDAPQTPAPVEKNSRIRIEGSLAEKVSQRLLEMFPKPSAIEVATEAAAGNTIRTTYEAMEDDGGSGQPMNSEIYVYAPAERVVDDKIATEAVTRCLEEGKHGRSVIYLGGNDVIARGVDNIEKRAASVGVLTLYTEQGLATFLRAMSS